MQRASVHVLYRVLCPCVAQESGELVHIRESNIAQWFSRAGKREARWHQGSALGSTVSQAPAAFKRVIWDFGSSSWVFGDVSARCHGIAAVDIFFSCTDVSNWAHSHCRQRCLNTRADRASRQGIYVSAVHGIALAATFAAALPQTGRWEERQCQHALTDAQSPARGGGGGAWRRRCGRLTSLSLSSSWSPSVRFTLPSSPPPPSSSPLRPLLSVFSTISNRPARPLLTRRPEVHAGMHASCAALHVATGRYTHTHCECGARHLAHAMEHGVLSLSF